METGTRRGGASFPGVLADTDTGLTDVQPRNSTNIKLLGMEDSIPMPMAPMRKLRRHKYQAMRRPVSHSSLTKADRLNTNQAMKPIHNSSPTTPCSSRIRAYSFSTSIGRLTWEAKK